MTPTLLIFATLLVVFILFAPSSAESFSQRRRRSKEVEDKLSKLDEATKQRIHAMKASGMPNEAIAEKIAYTAGGKGTAKRIVEALQQEGSKRSKPAPKVPPKMTQQKAAQAGQKKAADNKRK